MSLYIFTIYAGILSLICLYLPLFNMLYNSFSLMKNGQTFLTLYWYQKLFDNSEISRCFFSSFSIAFFSASLSIVIALFLCFCRVLISHKSNSNLSDRWLWFFEIQMQIPLLVSDTIYALAMMLFFFCSENFFNRIFFSLSGYAKILITHATFGVGFVYLILIQKLENLDFSLQEAALDLGVRPHIMFLSIVLPLLKPAIFVGWAFVFLISLDDVIMTTLVGSGSVVTLPQYILSVMRLSSSPVIDALSSFLMLIALVVIVLTIVFSSKNQKRR